MKPRLKLEESHSVRLMRFFFFVTPCERTADGDKEEEPTNAWIELNGRCSLTSSPLTLIQQRKCVTRLCERLAKWQQRRQTDDCRPHTRKGTPTERNVAERNEGAEVSQRHVGDWIKPKLTHGKPRALTRGICEGDRGKYVITNKYG